jgi:HK97 gp10 family phage protein
MTKKLKYDSVSLEINFDELRTVIADTLDQAMFEGGNEILDVAAPKTPFRQGNLRESGYVATQKRSSYKGGKGHRKEIRPKAVGAAVIAFSWFTARFWELGTRHLPARPFLRPGFDERRNAARDSIVRILRHALEAT